MSDDDDPTCSAEQLYRLTGYKTAPRQLAELHRLGYWRARRAKTDGRVIVERAHVESVSSDGKSAAKRGPAQPQLHLVKT